jgi:hypothetical protein
MTTKSSSLNTDRYSYSFVAIGGDGKFEVVDGKQRLKWNDYSCYYIQERRTPGQSPRFIGDVWFPSGVLVPSLIANDELTLLSRLSEKVKGHSFNLAVAAAEGKKTVSMVSNAIQSIGGAVLDLKRGRFESAARRFGVNPRPSRLSHKDVAGRWLELQYGWLPLLSDVYESSKAYEALTKQPRKELVTVTFTKRFIHNASNAPINYSCEGNAMSGMRICYEMTEQMSAPRSLGLTDPLSVAWELLPYSFVVDWFVPIGTYLENLNTIPSLRGRFMTTTLRRFSGSAVSINPSYNWTVVPTTQVSQVILDRKISTSLSVPKPSFNSFEDAMSPKRIWNAIALAVQRF